MVADAMEIKVKTRLAQEIHQLWPSSFSSVGSKSNVIEAQIGGAVLLQC